MSVMMSRVATYCHHVERHVNYEISWHHSDGQLDCSATCTGIEDTCESCPVLQMNRTFPVPSEEGFSFTPRPLGSKNHFHITFTL